ncbi:MAG: MFS transporter [Chloroflexi bacterium]|nr:MFS transporter [Chloroflexota bacterium]
MIESLHISHFSRTHNLFERLKNLRGDYPSQFWLIFLGNLISTIGMSMIWPFMVVYASEKLELPLTAVAGLMTINSAMSLIASFVAGSLTDRIGRRIVMIVGMTLHGIVYFFFIFADSLSSFIILMAVSGFISPIYRVGVDAMVADLIPSEKRVDAYALLRMGNNVGVALGPTIGGFLAAVSYSITFGCASAGLLLYGLLTFLFTKETLPARTEAAPRERFGGYGKVIKDRVFISVTSAFTISTIGSSMVFVLLSVYTKGQFGIPENQFGFIMAANAGMVVLFQVLVTRISKRFNPYNVMTIGALFYALGVGSMALGNGFWDFMISIIVMTVGEMLLVPTTSTLVANLAPPDMRGRYMSLYGLTWGIASGIGPLLGGFLNDNIAPVAIWYGGGLIGLVSVVILAVLAARHQETAPHSGTL